MQRSTKKSNRLLLRLAKSTVLPLSCPRLKSKRTYSRFLKPNSTQRGLTENKRCVFAFFASSFGSRKFDFYFPMISFQTPPFRLPKSKFLRLFYTHQQKVYHSSGTKQFSIPSTFCMAQSMLLCVVQVLSVPAFANLGREVPADSASLLLASIPLHKNISLAVIVCNPGQKEVWSRRALKRSTKDIKRWCVGNYITPTLQKSTFLLCPIWLQFDIGHKNFLSSHSP